MDAAALEAATGSTVSQLATRYGYSYGGMLKLTQRDDFKVRVAYYAKRVEDMKFVAQRKLMLHLPPLLDSQLAVALSGTNPDTGEVNIEQASKPAVQKAAMYLIDKVLPTTTRVENAVETINAPETREVLTELRTVLRRINDERGSTARNLTILDSPHVLEGIAALPSPLLAKVPEPSPTEPGSEQPA